MKYYHQHFAKLCSVYRHPEKKRANRDEFMRHFTDAASAHFGECKPTANKPLVGDEWLGHYAMADPLDSIRFVGPLPDI